MDLRRVHIITIALLLGMGVCNAFLAYKQVSILLSSGTPCMTTCVNGECFDDHYLVPSLCRVDSLAGVPRYNTVNRRGGVPYCLSNCGKWGGYSYMWCYTSNNYDWDYCNDEVYRPGVNPSRDIYGNRCIDDCVLDAGNWWSPPSCRVKYDDNSRVTCIKSATVPVSSCPLPNVDTRSRRALDKLFGQAYCNSRTCVNRFRYGRDGETAQRAANIHNLYNNVDTININFEDRSPYFRVSTTTMTNNNGENVLMPLVLEALITDAVYQRRSDSEVSPEGVDNVNRMYNVNSPAYRPGIHVGHLLAFSNGGTTDLFNYAGQTAGLNTGPYKAMENMINGWLRHGHVSFTVVVVYDQAMPTRPSEFYVKIQMYNSDGSLHSDCLDMVFSNN